MPVKQVVICALKAALVAAAACLLFAAVLVLLLGVPQGPHAFEELGVGLGGQMFPVLLFLSFMVFWSRAQVTRIVRFQDKRIFMDRLDGAVAKMRLKETRRSDTLLSFKLPFSRKELSIDVSQPDLATLSGMYLTVMSLEKRLTRP